jgi:MoxR-like ATPase
MADEINSRASPRTQSALLQATQERATIAGQRYADLPRPFHTCSRPRTRWEGGTYPPPEAQLDRFLRVDVGYPDREAEQDADGDHGRRREASSALLIPRP